MYTLTVTNHYWRPVVVANSAGASFTVPLNGSMHPSGPLGNATITVPGLGEMMVHDIGDRQIGGYSKATWGVLLAYQGEEMVFRYEGGGELSITFNDFGQAELQSNGGISQVNLGAFVLPG
ncbi:MAG TPA: hypothetical protein VF613_20300 [Longimicrobium sp.]|jgi:hypothetical protein